MGPCVVGRLVAALLLLAVLLRGRPWSSGCDALSFRVLSWNVLAPVHAPAAKYPWTDPRHLEWSYRCARIAEFLRHERADVVCLQEVQLGACWEELYRTTGLDAMYECVLQNVTRGHPVANAVLVRRDGGPLRAATTTIRAVESRSRALIVVLEIGNNNNNGTTHQDRDANGSRFVALANVHLEAGMEAEQDETRFCQLQSLMKRIHRHCQELMKAPTTDDSAKPSAAPQTADPSIVLVGDWNMLPYSALYQLLSTGRLHDPTNRHARIQLPLPLLPLRDAFAPRLGRDAGAGTYAGGSVLDYVWVSKDVRVQGRWVQRPLAREGVQPEIRTAQRRRHRRRFFLWPSSHHPSDHVAIGATLQL